MNAASAHFHTRALIDAWKRLAPDGDLDGGPEASEYPGLIDNLFVLSCGPGGELEFRNVGSGVERLFGRDLVEHDFLSLWQGHDRQSIVTAAKRSIGDHAPLVLRGASATLEAADIVLEFTLAPIGNSSTRQPRFLGLCQQISTSRDQPKIIPSSLRLASIDHEFDTKARSHLRLVVSNG